MQRVELDQYSYNLMLTRKEEVKTGKCIIDFSAHKQTIVQICRMMVRSSLHL